MPINTLRRYGQSMTSGLIVALLLAVGIGCFPPSASAATAVKSKGLTLSPLRSELEIAPGTSMEANLTVTNSTDSAMNVQLGAERFSVINPQYDYAFDATSDLTSWLSFKPAQVELQAGQTKQISYAVGVPLTAEPGGRYISLFASTDTGASGGIVSRQRVASLLYITVQGSVSRAGHLISLSCPWLIGGPGQWDMALQNSGTTHFRSRYSVSLQGLIGDQLATTSGDALILPGTVRAVADVLPAPPRPGIYKIVYSIGLGDTPEKVETRYLIFFPPAALVVLAVMVGLLVICLRRWRTRR